MSHCLFRYLNIRPGNSRAALVVYGFKPFVRVGFEDYDDNFDKFMTAVNRAPYIGGERRTDKAVETAMDLFHKARPSVPKIAILVTAGKPSEGASLEATLRPLRDSDVRTYVVYIGSDMKYEDVQVAVEKPQDAFQVQEYENLRHQVDRIARHVNFDSGKI